MESLDQIFHRNGADKDMAHHGYSRHYEKLFEPLRHQPITLLEIGVQYGWSIQAWLDYFTKAHIIGIDRQNLCNLTDPRYTFIQGDQTSGLTFTQITSQLDIVIDDGSHIPDEQTVSFIQLWPKLNYGGLYIIEDTHPNHDPKHDPMYHRGSRELLWHIAGAINWFGKNYYGRPFESEVPDAYERSFESVTLTRGLMVIQKSQ